MQLKRSGLFGRYDVMFEPLDPGKGDGIIMEFKVFQHKREKYANMRFRSGGRRF